MQNVTNLRAIIVVWQKRVTSLRGEYACSGPTFITHPLAIQFWFDFFCIQYNVLCKPIFSQKISEKFSRVIAKVAFISTWLHSVKLSTPAFFQNKRFLEKTRFYFCRSRMCWWDCAKNPEIEINLLNLVVFIIFFDILLLLSRFNIILFPSSRLTSRNARNTNCCFSDYWCAVSHISDCWCTVFVFLILYVLFLIFLIVDVVV